MESKQKFIYKITVADLAPHVHTFFRNENKVDKIFLWLKDWINSALEDGRIQPYYLLPTKGDLASHIGVSQGTIQSVYRLLEDAQLVESKQRMGTYIKCNNETSSIEKLTSKREIALEIIKKHILENDYKIGDCLISTRKLAIVTGISNTTLVSAMAVLVSSGILKKDKKAYIIADLNIEIEEIQYQTLVEKVVDLLKDYINKNCRAGEKLPPNSVLKDKFRVSAKTIHDAIKILVKEGLLHTRRGKYGTCVLNEDMQVGPAQYVYERFEQKIRQYIIENCEVGDKLPSIKDISKIYCTSEKSIKRALDNLAEDGYLAFSRGRYGGTFVLDIPQVSSEAYKWLAISTDFINN